MAQQIINTGAVANDGTGDPLRTAFTETNNNFTEIYTAGPVDSNVRIIDNSILTLNTNGNLVLAPNGTGRVVANVDIVPNQANVRNLGGSARRWSTLYLQYADISNTVTVGGDLTVGGNLTVSGNIIQVGNIVTDSLTIQLGNTAANAAAANGAGITVGASDNIATLLYNSTSNVWTMNIGLSAVGNVTAPYFVGNGSLLTGLAATYGNANVVTLLAGFGSNTISTTGNVSGGYLFGNGSQLTGLAATYGNANVATFLAAYGSNTIVTTGNITAGNVLTSAEVIASGVIQSGTGLFTGGYLSVNGTADLHDTNIIGNLSVNVIRSDDSTVVKIQDGVEVDGDAVVNGDVTANTFVGTGNLYLQPDPANAGSYLDIYLTGGPDLHLVSSAAASLILGYDNGPNVKIGGDFDGNVYVQSWDGTTSTANTWIFEEAGNLTLPTLSLGTGLDEQTVVQSQRKIIPPFRWSAVIDGATPTVVYTAANPQTTSMKVTVQVQHSGFSMEFFDVSATKAGADTYYTVSNRVAPPTIAASTVVVDLNGSTMQITVTVNSGAATSWVTYDAVEFGIPND